MPNTHSMPAERQAQHPAGVKREREATGASTSPSSSARSIASLRLDASSFRYAEIACVFTVLRETKRRSAISRNVRWVVSRGRSRSSAAVSDEAQPSSKLATPASRSRRSSACARSVPSSGRWLMTSKASRQSVRAPSMSPSAKCVRASSSLVWTPNQGMACVSCGRSRTALQSQECELGVRGHTGGDRSAAGRLFHGLLEDLLSPDEIAVEVQGDSVQQEGGGAPDAGGREALQG